MPRWKAAVQAAETLEAVEKAAEAEKADRECTYEVLARVDVFEKPDVNSGSTLILSRGERIIGTVSEIGGFPWLKLSRKTIETHPLRYFFSEGGAWVLVADPRAALGTGRYLVRAPAELGWRSACEAGERPEILEVVGAGGLPVIVDEESGGSPDNFLVEVGSLIKVVKVDTERGCMAFELMTGGGPESGWVSLESWGSASLQRASIDDAGAPVRRERARQAAPAQDPGRCEEAMRLYASRLMMREEANSSGFGHREVLPWRCRLRAQERDEDEEVRTDTECEVQEELVRDLASSDTTTKTPSCGSSCSEEEESEDAELPHGVCRQCGLPLGQLVYTRPGSEEPDRPFPEYLHGECMAQCMLHALQEEEKEAQEQERIRKQKRREEYGIGWSADRIPLNAGPARALTGRAVPHGLCALAVAKDNRVAVVPTASPAAAVNLEYLSVALRVRKEEDREPLFSLDPVTSSAGAMQVKRFEPYWLKSTSVGDILFESDYHLKELSMGEHEQPVIGMKSCKDLEDIFTTPAWVGREWFVVRKADVMMAEDGVLVPVCKMGVEAREEVIREDGRMEDARVTKPDHPMVKYAEMFTHFFDLIAERKSVIYHLRELAKASILAKYLLMSSVNLESLWFDLFETKDEPCILEIPQLWNEYNFSEIGLRDGRIVDDAPGTIVGGVQAVYGGVQFGLNRFRMGPGGPAAGAVQSRIGVSSSVAAKRGFFAPTRLGARGPAGIPRVAAVMAGGPRGVDLGLGKFPLDQTQVSPHLGPLSLAPDVGGCASLGSAFWEQLEGTSGSVFSGEQRDLLKRVFDPRLSDRRTEGELFQPPDVDFAYCNKLRCLLNEEDEVRRQRKAHFLSRQFDVNDAGPLFPCWASSFRLQDGRQKASLPPAGRLKARPDWLAQASQLRHLLHAPVFERPTEDGLTFRIYRLGSLEVRTTQDVGRSEVVGAVFSRRSAQESTPSRRRGATELGSERVAKVTEYVESDPAGSSRTACRYYVVSETEQGNRIVCELLQGGKVAWSEDPEDLDDRNSLARVVDTAEATGPCEGSGFLVDELKEASHQATRQGERRRSARARRAFADELFSLVAREVADAPRERRVAPPPSQEGWLSSSSASSSCGSPPETCPLDMGDV